MAKRTTPYQGFNFQVSFGGGDVAMEEITLSSEGIEISK